MDASDRELQNQALDLARLAGPSFPVELLTAVLGTEKGVLALLDQAILLEDKRPGWVVLSSESDSLPHGRIKPVVEREQSLKLAKAAEALRMPEDRVATYYAAALYNEQARRYWIRAAEKSCDRKAYPDALEYLNQALEVWPWTEAPTDRVRIMREFTRCAAVAGDLDTARRTWEELLEFARDQAIMGLQVEALGQLAGLADDAVAVTACYKEAAELAEAHLTPAQAVRPLLEYVDNLASRVRIRLAGEVIQRTAAAAEATGSPATISEVRGWQGLIAAMSGAHAEANAFVEESLKLALEHELPEQAALAYRRRANIAEYGSEYEREVTAQLAAIQYCKDSEVGDQMNCLSCLAYACFRTGDWQQADESAQSVLDDPDAHIALKAVAQCVVGLMASFQGRRKAAAPLLQQSLDQLRLNGLLGLEFMVMLGQAYLRMITDRPGDATRIFDEIRTLWRETDDVHDVIPSMLFAGGHYANQGHAERLADCIDILMEIHRKNPLDEARAVLITLKGEQILLGGDSKGFASAMREASQLFGRCGLPLEQAWTGISAATAGDSSERVQAAIRIAKRLGLRPFLAAVESHSQSTAEVPGNDLTPRQKDVLQLLAQGMTSKEMADHLSLSTRTVEMHVGRLLERMNCRTRSEAVHLASERGWV